MSLDRRTIRYLAAALAALMAGIYYLIGLRVLDVGTGGGMDTSSLTAFGFMAGSAFALGAILLVAFDRRWLWIVGAVFQLFVIWAYIDIAKQRTPDFEVWGITLRIIQVPLLLALAYLALRFPDAHAPLPARRR